MTAILAYWKYSALAFVLAGLGVWHVHDKARAIEEAVALIQADYVMAALASSEATRTKEHALNLSLESLRNELQNQKTRNSVAARVSAGKLRDLQAAIASARASSSTADPEGSTGASRPFADISSECSRAFIEMDAYAAELAVTSRALQQYANSLQVK